MHKNSLSAVNCYSAPCIQLHGIHSCSNLDWQYFSFMQLVNNWTKILTIKSHLFMILGNLTLICLVFSAVFMCSMFGYVLDIVLHISERHFAFPDLILSNEFSNSFWQLIYTKFWIHYHMPVSWFVEEMVICWIHIIVHAHSYSSNPVRNLIVQDESVINFEKSPLLFSPTSKYPLLYTQIISHILNPSNKLIG